MSNIREIKIPAYISEEDYKNILSYANYIISRTKKIHNETHTPNKITAKAIESAINDENLYGPFNSVDELMDSLNA